MYSMRTGLLGMQDADQEHGVHMVGFCTEYIPMHIGAAYMHMVDCAVWRVAGGWCTF